jgi:hypothetical protein
MTQPKTNEETKLLEKVLSKADRGAYIRAGFISINPIVIEDALNEARATTLASLQKEIVAEQIVGAEPTNDYATGFNDALKVVLSKLNNEPLNKAQSEADNEVK